MGRVGRIATVFASGLWVLGCGQVGSGAAPIKEGDGPDAGYVARGLRDAGVDGSRPRDGGPGDATIPDAPSGGPYSGFVLAQIQQTATGNHFWARADFRKGGPFDIGGCPADDSDGSCCCVPGIGLPLADEVAAAGIVTLAAATGSSSLVSLGPAGPTALDGGAITYNFYGTSYMGAMWSFAPGSYDAIEAAAWTLGGGTLLVSASGGQVAAFSGVLRTAPHLTGVTPSFDAAVAIDRSHDFSVSWDPGGATDDSVLLVLRQITMDSERACYCTTPDAPGVITVDPDVLRGFETEQMSCSMELERVRTSRIETRNAVVELVGASMVSTDATFR